MAGPHVWIQNVPSAWAASSFDTGLLPGSNEKVIFNERGIGDVVSSLNQTAVDLDLLDVQEGYEGRIGADGDPLIISADEVFFRGSGRLAYQDGSGTTDLMIVDSPNLVNAVTLSGATVTRLRVRQGKVGILPTFTGTIATLEVDSEKGSYNAVVEALSGTNLDITSIVISSGHVFGDINVGLSTSIFMSSGLFSTNLGQSTVTAVAYLFGGTFEWFPDRSNVGVTPTWSGTVHVSNATVDCRNTNPKVLSDVRLWEGGQILYSAFDSVTLARMEP